jgi:hypothetical protein
MLIKDILKSKDEDISIIVNTNQIEELIEIMLDNGIKESELKYLRKLEPDLNSNEFLFFPCEESWCDKTEVSPEGKIYLQTAYTFKG